VSEALIIQASESAGFEIVHWKPLTGGLTNHSFLLETLDGPLVLRVNDADVPGVDRYRENLILEAVSTREMAPMVILNDLHSGYLLYQYIDQPSWQAEQFKNSEALQSLGQWFRRLHRIDLDVASVDPLACAHQYVAELSQFHPIQAAKLRRHLDELTHDLFVIGYYDQIETLCHMDPVAGNIFGEKNIQLIDWEFAAYCNPWFDLSLFIHYGQLSLPEFMPLLDAYFTGDTEPFLDSIPVLLELAELLELSWLALRQATDKLGAQGQDKLSRLSLTWDL